MKQFIIGTAVMLVLATTSCIKKVEEETVAPTTLATQSVKNIDASGGGGHFTFYSLKDNKVVPLADSASTKWDIGFRSTTLIVNANTSGPGAGGALVQTGIFNDYATAPTTGYRVDSTATAPITYAVPTGSNKGWYNYDGATRIITPLAGKFIAVRTAEGKYAKLEILSYYKDAPTAPDASSVSKFYSFRFVYQPSGTKLQ